MIAITLPDGSVKQLEEGVTPMDVALSISEGLARNVISAAYNGQTVESSTPLTHDGSLVLYTWRDEAGKKGFLAFIGTYFSTSITGIVSWYKINHWTRH